jgi:hypothetical protein
VRTETVFKLYNILILPTFLYGSGNWTLTASQRKRIETAEVKLLRPLAGYTLYDHKTNKLLHTPRITDYKHTRQDRRIQKEMAFTQRMSQNRIPLKLYNYRPQGRRLIGRPKKRW